MGEGHQEISRFASQGCVVPLLRLVFILTEKYFAA